MFYISFTFEFYLFICLFYFITSSTTFKKYDKVKHFGCNCTRFWTWWYGNANVSWTCTIRFHLHMVTIWYHGIYIKVPQYCHLMDLFYYHTIALLRSDRTNEYSMAWVACCLMFVLMFPQAVFSSVFYFASVPLYQGFLIIGWVCECWWLICTCWNIAGISVMFFRQLWHLRIAEGFVPSAVTATEFEEEHQSWCTSKESLWSLKRTRG